jgi:hypothetical protein
VERCQGGVFSVLVVRYVDDGNEREGRRKEVQPEGLLYDLICIFHYISIHCFLFCHIHTYTLSLFTFTFLVSKAWWIGKIH